MLETALLKHIVWIFTKLTITMLHGTETDGLNFGVKRSKFKVSVK